MQSPPRWNTRQSAAQKNICASASNARTLSRLLRESTNFLSQVRSESVATGRPPDKYTSTHTLGKLRAHSAWKNEEKLKSLRASATPTVTPTLKSAALRDANLYRWKRTASCSSDTASVISSASHTLSRRPTQGDIPSSANKVVVKKKDIVQSRFSPSCKTGPPYGIL